MFRLFSFAVINYEFGIFIRFNAISSYLAGRQMQRTNLFGRTGNLFVSTMNAVTIFIYNYIEHYSLFTCKLALRLRIHIFIN